MPKQITRAEFDVMEVLWRKSPLGAAEVADHLSGSSSRSLKTIKTLLSRLVEKGALAHEPDGRRYLYRPMVSRAAYVRSATGRLADQLFGGRVAPLVAHLAMGRGLSDDDIQELETLLSELKRDDN